MASRSDVLATRDGDHAALRTPDANLTPPADRPKRTPRLLAWMGLVAGLGFVGYGAAHAASPTDFAHLALGVASALGGMIVYTLIPFLALVLTLITVHELGHYAAARYAGLNVLDFSIGMGKAIYQRQGRHNTWTLRLLPLGGYVRVAEDGPRGLNAASTMTRIGFTAAGPAVNIVLAFLFFVIAFGQGLTFTRNVVAEVIPGSPAAVAGVQPGDRIVAINGVGVRSFDDILVGSMYGSETQVDHLGIERPAAHSVQNLNLDVRRQNRIYGVRFKREQADSLGSAMAMARDQMAASVWSMIHLPFLVSANGGDPITVFSGPVGIAHVTGDVVRSPNAGLVGLQLVALLNLGLAVINLLPLPIFDGGRILIYAIEGLVRRRTPVRLQNFMAGASLGVILMFGTMITAKDVIELMSG